MMKSVIRLLILNNIKMPCSASVAYFKLRMIWKIAACKIAAIAL